MFYSREEVELTLSLYSIAKVHLNDLERKQLINGESNTTNFEKNCYHYYSYIINIVHSWINTLLPDEAEIIQKRIIDKNTFDFIAIQLGYANHSSVIRKNKNILNKLSLQEIQEC